MNIELKPIAESKVRQLGGDVCGVLVRTDGGVMAVSEHGRCTRLDGGVMGPVDGAQGGQGAEAVKWSDPAVDPIVSKLYRKFKEWNRQGFGADDVTWCEVRGYVAELLNAQPKPAQPEGWISMADRQPTKSDEDCEGKIWLLWPDRRYFERVLRGSVSCSPEFCWMPTGLKRPQPPQEGE